MRETTGGNTTEHYLHFDHLGSVEAISDADGMFVTRMSFDAYGNRRNSDWTPTSGPATRFATEKGFTGHDMVDAEAVVHMGGRVYDPALGRFLSADLYVQAPDSSQSYNRYAYVTNNPLSRVDPTGYEGCKPDENCSEVIGKERKRREYDEDATLRGLGAMYFLRDWVQANSDWRQMAQLGGEWTGAALETAFSWTVQPMFEGGIEIVFNIQTGNYSAAIGAGINTGAEMSVGKIARGAKAAEKALEGATTVIGRVKDLQKLNQGEKSLLDRLPDQGSPKANWKQNSGVLREEMAKGKPIRDASPGDTKGQFLNAERNLLESRGWTLDKSNNFWNPPQ